MNNAHNKQLITQTSADDLDNCKRRPFVSLGSFVAIAAVVFIVGFVTGTRKDAIFTSISNVTGIPIRVHEHLDFSSVNDVYNELRFSFNGELDKEALITGAKRGLVAAAGDRHTVFMDDDEAAEFRRELQGDFGAGIGVEIGMRNDVPTVIRALRDNPAIHAGVRAGDIFYRVNDEDVSGFPADQVASRVRGPAGTSVRIIFLRDGEEVEVNIVRERINNPSVELDFDGDTAILTISRFDADSGRLAREAAQQINERGTTNVILDLRGNTGGYVSAAQAVLGLWLNNQIVLRERTASGSVIEHRSTSNAATLYHTNTVVLANGFSASASEIVVGAFIDHRAATFIGETTFGKGSVQSMINIRSGGMLKVTTSRWFTPNDRDIENNGISPDIEVIRTFDDVNDNRDPQLQAALDHLRR